MWHKDELAGNDQANDTCTSIADNSNVADNTNVAGDNNVADNNIVAGDNNADAGDTKADDDVSAVQFLMILSRSEYFCLYFCLNNILLNNFITVLQV